MSREELIECLALLKEQARNSGVNTFVWDINIDSFNFVIDSTIKTLEQEPVLDKIRAEIERGKIGLDIEFNGGIDYALGIIDKYKAKSEKE